MNKQNKLPNFFIVGAAKAGTSSLWQNLKENPLIFMPKDELNKEPGFFSDIYGNKKNKNINRYLKLFETAGKNHKLVGEASTTYLTDPSSAKNIHDFAPNAKIVIVLRNPAERAFSLYNWNVQEGYEYIPTFELALRAEKYRINKKIPNFFEPQYYYNYLYFNSGLYYQQVKRYLDLFGRSNVHIIKFDDLKNNFEKTYTDLCDFLKIEKNKTLPRSFNKSKNTYSSIIQFILRKINNSLNKHLRRKISSKKSRDRLLDFGLSNKEVMKLNSKTRKSLLFNYNKEIIKLSNLTEINFNDWIKN